MRSRHLVLAGIACVAAALEPQLAGAAGIRILTSSAGSCFQTISPGLLVNLLVTYDPAYGFTPQSPTSITGAEFRLELGEGLLFSSFTPYPAGSVVTGTPIDGIHLEFTNCATTPQDMFLGTLTTITFLQLPQQTWHVRGGATGSGACPLVRTCAPELAWVPVLGAEFTLNSNSPPYTCYATLCETIAVEANTWGAIKSVYR